MRNCKKLYREGKYLGIFVILILITNGIAGNTTEETVSIEDIIDDTTANVIQIENSTLGSDSDTNDTEGLETGDAETESHTFLRYTAYAIGWLFVVIGVFIAAAILFCFLTAISGVAYWTFKGSRRLFRKCFYSKESDMDNWTSAHDGNWILREASTMKPF